MGLDSLFERLVVATERIASSMEGATVRLAVELPDVSLQPEAKPAEAPKRGRPRKDAQPEVAPVVEAATTVAAPTTAPVAAQKSFLDDEDEAPAAAPAVPELTEAEHRAEIRKQMLTLQKALDPDRALSILVKAGKAETLKSLKPENFGALYAAIAAAMPKAA